MNWKSSFVGTLICMSLPLQSMDNMRMNFSAEDEKVYIRSYDVNTKKVSPDGNWEFRHEIQKGCNYQYFLKNGSQKIELTDMEAPFLEGSSDFSRSGLFAFTAEDKNVKYFDPRAQKVQETPLTVETKRYLLSSGKEAVHLKFLDESLLSLSERSYKEGIEGKSVLFNICLYDLLKKTLKKTAEINAGCRANIWGIFPGKEVILIGASKTTIYNKIYKLTWYDFAGSSKKEIEITKNSYTVIDKNGKKKHISLAKLKPLKPRLPKADAKNNQVAWIEDKAAYTLHVDEDLKNGPYMHQSHVESVDFDVDGHLITACKEGIYLWIGKESTRAVHIPWHPETLRGPAHSCYLSPTPIKTINSTENSLIIRTVFEENSKLDFCGILGKIKQTSNEKNHENAHN